MHIRHYDQNATDLFKLESNECLYCYKRDIEKWAIQFPQVKREFPFYQKSVMTQV